MSRPPRSLARRYARALLEVANAEGGARALALRDELRAFVPQLDAHPQLRWRSRTRRSGRSRSGA